MKKVLFFTLLIAVFSLAGCNRSQATTTAPAQNQNATAAPALPTAPAVAPSISPSVTTPMSSPVPTPFMTGKPGKDAKGKKKPTQAPQMPPGMDRMYRALTLEEINQLPPETRDMILRAQGRMPAATPPKK